MAKTPINFPFTGGLDRSVLPLRADPATFYDLLNFRHSQTSLALLEQTPYFTKSTIARGTYYDSGSLTEPTTSQVRMITQSHLATEYVLRSIDVTGAVGSQLQVYHQTAVPTGTGLIKHCAVDFTAGALTTINLGGALDIVIDGATTFKWRVNGGAYTTLVPITTTGVSISGIIFVYFLTATGFNVGDTWTWTRTDSMLDPSGNSSRSRQLPYVYHQDKLYFITPSDRVMVAYSDYAISIGYRPVYGSELCFFDDHLIVGDYSESAVSYQNVARAGIVGWSDKTDYACFYATDVNEADQYNLPNDVAGQFLDPTWANSVSINITGLTVQVDRLFVFTPYEVYYTDALGLPIVFSFKKLVNFSTTSFLIHAKGGVYIPDGNKSTFFDGSSFTTIAIPIGSFTPTLGAYNSNTKELILVDTTNGRLLCYQEFYKRWYTRGASFDRTVSCVRADNKTNIWLGTTHLGFIAEQTVSAQPSYDSAVGTAYTTPKITTQCIGQDVCRVKEVGSVYVGFFVDSASSSTYYSTGANIQCKLHWYNSNDGRITGTPTTHAGAVRVSTDPDGRISFPHVSYRSIAFELQINGLVATKPPMQISVTALEPFIRDERQNVER